MTVKVESDRVILNPLVGVVKPISGPVSDAHTRLAALGSDVERLSLENEALRKRNRQLERQLEIARSEGHVDDLRQDLAIVAKAIIQVCPALENVFPFWGELVEISEGGHAG